MQEVYAGDLLLKATGLRREFVEVISCPTCARTEINVAALAEEVKKAIAHIKKHFTVAVMGCVVNGIGEGKHADIGVAGGKERSAIIKRGEVVKTVPNDRILDELLHEIKEAHLD